MSTKTQLRLAASRGGRILMHALAFATDHRLARHARGVWRELRRQGAANPLAMTRA